MIGEMAKMDSELKEVKEKLCTLTAAVGENKDEGRLNYAIKVIQLILILSRSQHVLNETEKSFKFFNLNNFWKSHCSLLLSSFYLLLWEVPINASSVERRSQLVITILLQLPF